MAAADTLARLTECYAEARYGDIEVASEVVLQLRAEAAAIGRDS